MELYAGLDRSGNANLIETRPTQNYYVVCLAAVEDRDELKQTLTEVRRHFDMATNDEFRGHDIGENVQLEFLRAVQSIGLYVGALIVNKEATRHIHTDATLPSNTDFQSLTSRRMFRRFFAMYPVAGLWCDEDIKGKERQQEFTTDVKRIHRECWPGRRCSVRHCASASVDVIQVADVVGYGLSRLARGVVSQTELRKLLEGIKQETGNVIMGPLAWEYTGEEA
jgi:hypothetical protein